MIGISLPYPWSSISLADLACHRSGLPLVPPNLSGPAWDPYCDWGRSELYDAMRTVQIAVPRQDRVTRYSNFGFAVLAEVLQRRARCSYADLVERWVCEPLGLGCTGLTVSSRFPRASGYSWSGQPVDSWDFNGMTGAGGLASNVVDLLTFGETLLHQRPTWLQAAAQCPDVGGDAPGTRIVYAMGWRLTRVGRTTIVWATGGVDGAAAFLGLWSEKRMVVAALLNSGRPVELARAGLDALSRIK
jgi:CubicO group peptidase (beta-lactamase class C family)